MLRSLLPEVRNPVLQLPSAERFGELPIEARTLLKQLLLELSRDCAARAQNAWATHKPPMALYWKFVAVIARHISRCVQI